MSNDFSELIQHIDDKFTGVDRRFDEVDNKFAAVDKRFDEMKGNFNNLLTAVDSYAKRADTYFQEMVALSHKVDRHEKWLHEVAEKLGIKLKY